MHIIQHTQVVFGSAICKFSLLATIIFRPFFPSEKWIIFQKTVLKVRGKINGEFVLKQGKEKTANFLVKFCRLPSRIHAVTTMIFVLESCSENFVILYLVLRFNI